MIDSKGYRQNVGIILSNFQGRVFWARRTGQDAWQFPQGGIREQETPEEAMYRELMEETGLSAEDVEMMGCTSHWLRYKLPPRYIRRNTAPLCLGQKQIWYMLRFVGEEACVDLESNVKPEFDEWCWVDYWHPMTEVIFFKRQVYEQALTELAPLIFGPDEMPRFRGRS